MRTYLKLINNTNGTKPSEISRRLCEMGFVTSMGKYDYYIEWGREMAVDDAVRFADRIHEALQDCNVQFYVETY